MVVKHAHWTIALVVGHAGPEGAVDRELQVVGSQAVSMRVWVGEEATLKRDKAKRGYTLVAVCAVTVEMRKYFILKHLVQLQFYWKSRT